MFVVGDKRGQRFSVLAPKIPQYVTYDLNYDMIRLRLARATILLLKKYVQKTFDPFVYA